jgi:serine/threonine protein kinase
VQAGTRIGHYEILAPIGSGGMGDVWKARDTRLRREVAIKTLPAALAQDSGRLARLEREAALLASVNHDHIATIHGLEVHDGLRFLVLELVQGTTLEDRLRRGRIAVEEALTLALQLAHALTAAHDKGVIHRDLKPANIMITPEKRVKVLDFGIAKALADEDAETLTIGLTHPGAAIGTPAYMSPEQARGEAVGVQTDIWSFGAVLYEMLTGKSPFRRNTTAETFASVLESRPDYAALPAETPVMARRLVQRCMEKDPTRRLQHMGDVRILLEEALASDSPNVSTRTTAFNRRGPWVAVAVAAAVVTAAIGWLAGQRSPNATASPPIFVSIPFAEPPGIFPLGNQHLAVSADGSTVAYIGAAHRIWLRRLDRPNAISVESAHATDPFFSPDGEWIAAFDETALMKIPVRGGTPVKVTATSDRPLGGTWRADGTIMFATSEGLYQVGADGERKLLAKPDRGRGEVVYAWPHLLPGGEAILLTVVSRDAGPPQTIVLDLKTLERKQLFTGSSARYVPHGLLVYAADSHLNAVAFDAATKTVVGKPVSIPDVEPGIAADNGAANFAVSDNGTLIFSGPSRRSLRALEWIDRRGNRERLAVEPQAYGYAMVSPDGSKVAVERTTRGNRDIWILDLKRLTQVQLTAGPTEDMLPVWSADGRRVFFASDRSGTFDVYSQAADGGSDAKVEFAAPEMQVPNGVTPDGRQLVVLERYKDLSLLDFAHPDRLEPLLHGGADERLGEVSPDGRWLAYESNESGNQFEIVLRSFPDPHQRRDVLSVGGGRYPRWGPPQSHELYYLRPDGAMMAIPVTLSPDLQFGPAQKLFDWQKPNEGVSGRRYDVAPDGRFLVTAGVESTPQSPTPVSVVLNWLTSVRQQAGR